MEDWKASASATLIGSLPYHDRRKAIDLILGEISEIPIWPQLPVYRAEGMMVQYLEGLPGLCEENGRVFIDADSSRFDEELYSFYEEYLELEVGGKDILSSRFSFGAETGKTFEEFLATVGGMPASSRAVKGQITGPFTMLTAMKDQQQRALIYDERVRDVMVKHLAMKALWQIERLKLLGRPIIVFLDEPALAGFGSSAFISISGELVKGILADVIDAVHRAGALAGIHVCANTDWSLLFESSVDIINFDAYNYFEIFAIYKDALHRFLERKGVVAWGMVPTGDARSIQGQTARGLADRFLGCVRPLATSGFPLERILSQSLFTPSCGCGTLSEADAERVVRLTRELADIMKAYL